MDILEMEFDQAKEKRVMLLIGIDKILMVCHKDNIGSKKSILSNGGVLENEIVDDDGKICQRYWITL